MCLIARRTRRQHPKRQKYRNKQTNEGDLLQLARNQRQFMRSNTMIRVPIKEQWRPRTKSDNDRGGCPAHMTIDQTQEASPKAPTRHLAVLTETLFCNICDIRCAVCPT